MTDRPIIFAATSTRWWPHAPPFTPTRLRAFCSGTNPARERIKRRGVAA